MKATAQDLLIAKLFIKAAFPVFKVVINDDPAFKKKWENVKAIVQFRAKDDAGDLVCYLDFDNEGKTEDLDVKVTMAEYEGKPDIELTFASVHQMVVMLKGGNALPDIGSVLKCVVKKPKLTINTFMTLLKLKLMLPSAKLPNDLAKYMKVKLSLYMITTALSTANKMGWEGICNWTKQPDRIYQFVVGDLDKPQLACYLRVKAGNSKAGRGVYTRKNPFVMFHFLSVDGALNVLGNLKPFVKSVEDKDVEVIGAPEYGVQLNDIMAVLQDMLTSL